MSSTYQIGYSPNGPPSPSKTVPNPDESPFSKNKKISELRSKLDSLKDFSKDYDSLNNKYKQLMNDYSKLNEAKNRLEYEIKQRESEYNRRISDLKAENETLKLGLNDKMTDSKKIYGENDMIERELKLKDEEIEKLNERLYAISCLFDQNCNNKCDLVNITQDLNNGFSNLNEQIYKLKQDNIFLNKVCQDNEQRLKIEENEAYKLSNTINENKYDIQTLTKKVYLYEDNLKNLKNKLHSSNEINTRMNNNINNLEEELIELKHENNDLQNEIIKERKDTINIEIKNEKLENILMQKEKELKLINNDNKNFKIINEQYKNNKDMNKIRNDKLKNLVKILENQNTDMINEIDNILMEDRRMKELLARKGRINNLLRNNNDTLERSINNLDTYINTYENNHQYPSRYTYLYQPSYI